MKKTTTFASGDVAMQLSFLADLAANNDRRWFAEQRARFVLPRRRCNCGHREDI